MRYVVIAIFLVIIGVLSYLMIESIRRPVNFRNTWETRKKVVHERLEEIADLQKKFKVLRKDTAYAGEWDTLLYAFLNDSFYIQRISGDPFDTTQVVDTTEMMYPARDSMASILVVKGLLNADDLNAKREKAYLVWADTSQDAAQHQDVKDYLNLVEGGIKAYFNTLKKVPFSKDKEFMIAASLIRMEGSIEAQKYATPTFEVGTTIGDYMHEFEPSEYSMYDPNFKPGHVVKVGDLSKPLTTGNW